MRIITRTIWILSLVSLFTDVASEMLYPIMPIYLKSIGFSIVIIGVLEGVAEATAGLSKGYFGKMSDNSGRRLPFVKAGYFLSAVSKPLMAMFTFPLWIFLARTMDRLGKGIRTGARDAMLSDESSQENKGKAFGFHRSLDTVGACAGPTLALVFLYFYPEQYKLLFLIAFLPGIVAILLTLLLKDKHVIPVRDRKKTSFFDFIRYVKVSPAAYKKLLIGLLFFAVINSSDVFLILKIKEAGHSDVMAIGSYIFYNIVYAICSYPLGILADKIGLKRVFLFGLLVFSVVYFMMAQTSNMYLFILAFALYGFYAAATEGVSKAWISNTVDKKDVATAIGSYTGFQSICALLSSSLTGIIWYQFGAVYALTFTAFATLLIFVYFLFRTEKANAEVREG